MSEKKQYPVNLKTKAEEKRADQVRGYFNLQYYVNRRIDQSSSCGDHVDFRETSSPRKYDGKDAFLYTYEIEIENIVFKHSRESKIREIDGKISGFVDAIYNDSGFGKFIINAIVLERYSCPEFGENHEIVAEIMKNRVNLNIIAGNDVGARPAFTRRFDLLETTSEINRSIVSRLEHGKNTWNSAGFIVDDEGSGFLKTRHISAGFPMYFFMDGKTDAVRSGGKVSFPSIEKIINQRFLITDVVDRHEWDKEGWFLFYDVKN